MPFGYHPPASPFLSDDVGRASSVPDGVTLPFKRSFAQRFSTLLLRRSRNEPRQERESVPDFYRLKTAWGWARKAFPFPGYRRRSRGGIDGVGAATTRLLEHVRGGHGAEAHKGSCASCRLVMHFHQSTATLSLVLNDRAGWSRSKWKTTSTALRK